MMATHDPAIDAAVALLAANGYKVTRSRPNVARNVAQDGTGTLVRKSGKAHGSCVEHYRIEGYTQPICVLGERMVEGERQARQDAAEVMGFAAEVAALARQNGDMLRQIQARDALRQHEQHRAEAAKYDGKTLTGVSARSVVDGRYIGSLSCWGCQTDYRGSAA